jgi:hypothetical protein
MEVGFADRRTVGAVAASAMPLMSVTSAISTGIAIVHTRIHDEM